MSDEEHGKPSRSLGDYGTMLYRRRWTILLPLFVCWAIAWGVSWRVPPTFQSEALILIEQQKVPEQYVVPNITVNLQERLQSITQQVLSRTRLKATIDRLHLYRKHRRWSLSGGNPVERMRKDIRIDLVNAPDRPGHLTAFKIFYSAPTPQLAQQVNRELTYLFVEGNLKSEQQLSADTTAFLESQLAVSRAELDKQEAKIQAFKAAHLNTLPSQVDTNVKILGGLQTQLQAAQQGLDRANQQKLYLQSLLGQYQSVQAGTGSAMASEDGLDKRLADLRQHLQQARLRYTDDYPGVIQLKQQIAKTEKLKQELTEKSKQPAGSAPAAGPLATGAAAAIDLGASTDVQRGTISPIMQIQGQLKANELEIRNYSRQTKKLEGEIAAYQSRLNLTPGTEQELANISRGNEETKSNYDSLLKKQNASQLATDLQQQQQGEQFRVLDPPSLPTRPSAPNHLLFSFGGLAFGLALGLCLVAWLELTDVRIRQEKDLEYLPPLNVLIAIPHLDIPGEDRSRARLRVLEVSAVVVMAILIVVGNVYALYKG